MKKSIICSVLLLTLIPGCWRRKKTVHHTDDASPAFVEEREGRLFVDDVDEFVLEENDPFAPNAVVITEEARVEIFPEDEASQTLSTIYFDFDDSKIKNDQISTLKRNLEQIKKLVSQGITIVIEGHTCQIGSRPHNIHLSEQRAEAIRDWLVAQGIPANMIKVVGRGSEFRIVPEGNRDQLAPNRRVEFREIA